MWPRTVFLLLSLLLLLLFSVLSIRFISIHLAVVCAISFYGHRLVSCRLCYNSRSKFLITSNFFSQLLFLYSLLICSFFCFYCCFCERNSPKQKGKNWSSVFWIIFAVHKQQIWNMRRRKTPADVANLMGLFLKIELIKHSNIVAVRVFGVCVRYLCYKDRYHSIRKKIIISWHKSIYFCFA